MVSSIDDHGEDLGSTSSTHSSKVSPFPGDMNPSPDIHRCQAVKWFTDTHAGESLVHIKVIRFSLIYK